MADETDLKTVIENAISEPQSVQMDGQSVQQRPLADQIFAAKFLSGSTASNRPGAGMRMHKPIGNSAV